MSRACYAMRVAAILVFAALAACDGQRGAAGGKTESTAAEEVALPAQLFVPTPPADAKPVAEVKKHAAVGDAVVLVGRIGGQLEPFVENRAMFLLADRSLPMCSDRGDDHCPTPWDACCEPREDITAKTTTIQVVDGQGKPIKRGLNNANGLKPLAEVVVKGTVALKPDEKTMVVNATAIYVKP